MSPRRKYRKSSPQLFPQVYAATKEGMREYQRLYKQRTRLLEKEQKSKPPNGLSLGLENIRKVDIKDGDLS